MSLNSLLQSPNLCMEIYGIWKVTLPFMILSMIGGITLTTERQTLKEKYTFRKKLAAIGPGAVIVGSFIGPGTVVTATRAGAGYGYTLLWTIVFSFFRLCCCRACRQSLEY